MVIASTKLSFAKIFAYPSSFVVIFAVGLLNLPKYHRMTFA